MIASRVVSESELHSRLTQQGFEQTNEETDTGAFWKHTESGQHILVPKSVQGFYPDWLLWDVMEQVELLDK